MSAHHAASRQSYGFAPLRREKTDSLPFALPRFSHSRSAQGLAGRVGPKHRRSGPGLLSTEALMMLQMSVGHC